MKKPKAVFNWSGGKDSSFCLYKVLKSDEYEVVCLLTSVNAKFQRVSMHGVRVELLEQQAASIALPLVKMELPEMPGMKEYEEILSNTLEDLKKLEISVSIFGDIFLEDLRKYREEKLAGINLKAVFPLWKIPTRELAEQFIDQGFKAIIVCVNEAYLDKTYVGRTLDHEFLNSLPKNVDPCGEHGEYHSFVYDGPIFKSPIEFEKGEIVYRKYERPISTDAADNCGVKTEAPKPFNSGFWFCDLVPVGSLMFKV